MIKNTFQNFKDRALEKTITFFLKFIVFPFVRLIWIKKVINLNNIPKIGGAVLAFNHQSFFDFIGFMAIAQRPVYYLAAEKFYNGELASFWKPVLTATHQIQVQRNSKDKNAVYTAVYSHLKAGDLVAIFPEGTRCKYKNKMLRAFPGVARFATEAQVSVIPIGITGAYEILSRNDKKPKFKKILKFVIGEPISIPQTKEASKEFYQKQADEIMYKIATLSGKEYPY